eukprot:1162066-Pelagomonas_calceolata.AAC.11
MEQRVHDTCHVLVPSDIIGLTRAPLAHIIWHQVLLAHITSHQLPLVLITSPHITLAAPCSHQITSHQISCPSLTSHHINRPFPQVTREPLRVVRVAGQLAEKPPHVGQHLKGIMVSGPAGTAPQGHHGVRACRHRWVELRTGTGGLANTSSGVSCCQQLKGIMVSGPAGAGGLR